MSQEDLVLPHYFKIIKKKFESAVKEFVFEKIAAGNCKAAKATKCFLQKMKAGSAERFPERLLIRLKRVP